MEYEKNFNLSLIPVNTKTKKPLVAWAGMQKKKASATLITKWFKQYPDAGLGIVTGNLSGILVVDCDTQEGYQETMKRIPDAAIIPTVKTPRGHHLYFKYPVGSGLSVGQSILPGVDFRGEGGYVVCPPSVNGNGGQYTWIEGQSLNEIDPPEIPNGILEILSNCKKTPDKENPVEHKEIPAGFAMITNEVIHSPAFKALTNTARISFVLLRAHVKKKGQAEVIYPYSQATEYMEKRTFFNTIRQLVDIGFIEKKQSGGLFRRTNIYLFSERWRGFKAGAKKTTAPEREKRKERGKR